MTLEANSEVKGESKFGFVLSGEKLGSENSLRYLTRV